MTWDKIEIDHVKAFSMFDIFLEEDMEDAFNWENTQPHLKHDHRQKGIEYSFFRLSITIYKNLSIRYAK